MRSDHADGAPRASGGPLALEHQLSSGSHGAQPVEYERREPPPPGRKPTVGILKRTPSGTELAALSTGSSAHGADTFSEGGSLNGSRRGPESSVHFGGVSTQPHHRAHDGVLGTLQRLAHHKHGLGSNQGSSFPSSPLSSKRMSFSDQHGLDLSTVHEVPDTHYKRGCMQRNAVLLTCATCIVLTVCCIIAVVYTMEDKEPARR